jgi:prolyl-tRNA editing enzyme YbaK/EbsC (Cys-tRNA(Pro) deacylase)
MRSFDRVMSALHTAEVEPGVHELPADTRTAADTARALGTSTEAIVKSLLFAGCQSGRTYLVLIPGSATTDADLLRCAVGEPLEKLDARSVRKRTGFSIGGVAPFGHTHRPHATVMDPQLLSAASLYVGSGTPRAVLSISGKQLQVVSEARIAKVTQ